MIPKCLTRCQIETKTGGHLSCFIYHGARIGLFLAIWCLRIVGPNKAKSFKDLQKYDVVITTYGASVT